MYFFLIFLCPCVISTIRYWWPTRRKFLVYFVVPNQLYIFRGMFSPIIRSTWLYLQHLIQSTHVAAGRCHVPSRPWHRPASTEMDYIWSSKYSQLLLMMDENIAEICRADWVQINKPKSCILLVISYGDIRLLLLGLSSFYLVTSGTLDSVRDDSNRRVILIFCWLCVLV